MNEQSPTIAPNSCIRCRFELTCGYSPLAMLNTRTEQSFEPCCLGERSFGAGPFFERSWFIEDHRG